MPSFHVLQVPSIGKTMSEGLRRDNSSTSSRGDCPGSSRCYEHAWRTSIKQPWRNRIVDERNGGYGWTRTTDLSIMSAAL